MSFASSHASGTASCDRKACNPVSVNQAQLGHQQVCGLLLSPGTGVVLMLHAQPVELG